MPKRRRKMNNVPRDFPGLGILRCGVCDGPLVEHEMRPCPELGMDLIHASPSARKGDGLCIVCGKDALKRKDSATWTLYCSTLCRKRNVYKSRANRRTVAGGRVC